MEKPNKLTAKKLVILIVAVFLACLAIIGALAFMRYNKKPVASQDDYGYVNPDETKAETDEGFVIDGVLDEEEYQKNNWLYLHNTEGGADVDIAMTSYYGEKGMYFVYDVTERTPIFVNTDRASYLNSCIEMYLAPNTVTNLAGNSVFEIDLLPTGDMTFKKSNGKGGYVNVATTDDKMAVLGATTKGGEVNTEECNGYVLELFIPWDYMEKFDLHKKDMEDSFVYVDPAHITSFNFAGTDQNVDRYWYYFAQQQGASFSNVYQYFRFNKYGALGTVPITLEKGDNYTITGDPAVVPGMWTTVTIAPEQGYAINSVLVNGEEYIQKVNYSEDGSVILKVRGTVGGLKVSASAVAATEGNKTLSGTIVVNKVGGGSLEGVSASYKGPKGERPLEFDKSGKFAVTDLAQGYYTIIVEKEGYEKVTRTIYLNRDIETEIALEYQSFDIVSGTCWILDNQNHGILNKFGGAGVIMSKDAFNKFTVEANFKYHPELVKEADTDYFTQQRQGLRIKFSNEKVWHIDVMKENDKYIVQYAKFSGDNTMFSWRVIHEMSDAEIAKFTSDEGIKLEVQRDGKYANVYLDDKLIAVEVLDDAFAKCTAQIGFESWTANREIESIPYSITGKTDVDLSSGYFRTTKGWDLTNQYKGSVALIEGGRSNLKFADKFVNMDLTIRVRDDQTKKEYNDKGEEVFPRNDVLFVFENGAHVSFGVTSDANGAWIQALNNSANEVDGKETPYIYKRWASFGKLTEEEFAAYKDGGVDFRIVRYGTEVTLYIGDRMVAVADLTNNNRGVTADMPAEVTFRHYDDAGVRIEFPFSVKETFELVTINCVENATGKLKAAKNQYFVGDTVVLSAANADTYPTSMTVNGKDAAVAWDYTHTFTATEKEYTVEGTFADKVFVQNKQWNLSKQNEGSVVLTEGGRSDLKFYDKYTNMDLTVTVRDDQTEKEVNDKGAEVFPRNDVLLVFENGVHVSFGITSDAKGAWIQALNNSADQVNEKETQYIFRRYSSQGNLTAEEFAAYKEGGVELRIVRAGTDLHLYIGNRKVTTVDLTKMYQNSKTTEVADSGIAADTTMNVTFRHYDDAGVKLEVPFEVSTKVPATVKITDSSKNGKMVTDQRVYLVGDTISLTAKGEEGLYAYALKINGINVNLNTNETYSFDAVQKEYTLEGSFAERIWKYSKEWNLLQQNVGKMIVPNGDGDSGWVETVSNEYGDVDMTFTLRDQKTADQNFRAGAKLTFTNDESVSFSITNDKSAGFDTYVLQNMAGSIHNWGGADYTLTEAQVAKLTGEDGLEFRIVRVGDVADIYLDDVHVYEYDLSKNKEGDSEVADKTFKIGVRHYGNAGVDTVIPFEFNEAPEPVEINIDDEIEKGEISTQYINYFKDEKVVLKTKGAEGYYCSEMTINTKAVTPNKDETYSFNATEASYEITGEFSKRIFKNSDDWNLIKQNEGKLIIPNCDGDSGWVESYDATYGDVDITLTLKDQKNSDANFRTAVRFAFGNGENVAFTLTNDRFDNDATTKYELQNMGGTILDWYPKDENVSLYVLNDAQVRKLTGDSGIEFRIVRVGKVVDIYVDGTHAYEFELNTSDVAKDVTNEKMQIRIRHYGNVEKDVEIPFEIKEAPETVEINVDDTIANGTFTTEYINYFKDEVVALVPEGAAGYYYDSLTVTKEDGAKVDTTIDADKGLPVFTATEMKYDVTGTFALAVLNQWKDWDITNHNVGYLVVKGSGYSNGWIKTLTNNYREVSWTIKDQLEEGQTTSTDLNAALQFTFNNTDKDVFRVRLTTADSGSERGKYKVQLMDGNTITGNWTPIKELEQKHIEAIQSESGLEFRVKFVGTDAEIYLGTDKVKTLDLSAGEIGNATAEVQFRLYGNTGYSVVIPYELEGAVPTTFSGLTSTGGKVVVSDNAFVNGVVTLTPQPDAGYGFRSLKVNGTEVALTDGKYSFVPTAATNTVEVKFDKIVTLNIATPTNGTVKQVADQYLVGDTVQIEVEPATGYNCTGLVVKQNGTNVTLDPEKIAFAKGTYSFKAEVDSYEVEATFAEKIFVDNAKWDLTQQYNNLVVVPSTHGTGNSSYLEFAKKYEDFDLTINAKDYIRDNQTGLSHVIKMKFDNNKEVIFRVTYDSGTWGIQSMGGVYGYKWPYYPMTEEQKAAYQSDEGLDFRIVRKGTYLFFYLDGERVCEARDISKLWDGTGSTDITEEMPVTVSIRCDGNANKQIDVKYNMSTDVPEIATITSNYNDENGTVTHFNKYLVGDNVVLNVTPKDGFYQNLKVNDETVVLDWTQNEAKSYTYSFVAEATNTVTGDFGAGTFKVGTDNRWNWQLLNQNVGLLGISDAAEDSDSYWLDSVLNTYDNMDLRFTLRDQKNSEHNYRAAVRLSFTNSQYVTFTITNDSKANQSPADASKYELENMGGTILDWATTTYVLDDAQLEKIKGADGVEFRIVRVGNIVNIYVDNEAAWEFNISKLNNGTTDSNVQDKTARINMRFYGNVGVQTVVPYSITEMDKSNVYVSTNGKDVAYNGNEDTPYKTLEYALKYVNNGGTIHVADNVTVSSDTLEVANGNNVTITGDGATGAALNFKSSTVNLKDSVKFTGLNMTFANKATVYAWGNTLEIASDVTGIDKAEPNALTVYGGGTSEITASPILKLYAGIYQTIYGGGYKAVVNGNPSITIGGLANVNTDAVTIDHTLHGAATGHALYNLFGGGNEAAVNGNTTITIGDSKVAVTDTNASRFNYIFGGGYKGTVTKGCTVNFHGYAMSIYGGSRASSITGDTHVTMTGGYVQQIFGGCEGASMTGNTNVNVVAGEVFRRVYGGCYNATGDYYMNGFTPAVDFTKTYYVDGYTSVTIGTDANFTYGFTESVDLKIFNMPIGVDNALYAISRGESTFENERGTFIFNDTNYIDKYQGKLGYQDGFFKGDFSTQTHHYLVTTNGNTSRNSLGTVSSVGDKLRVVPADGYVAKISLDSATIYYSGETYHSLPTLVSKDVTYAIQVTFVDDAVLDNCVARIDSVYYANAAEAIDAAEKLNKDLVVLKENTIGKITATTDTSKGTVTAKVNGEEAKYYTAGEDIVVDILGKAVDNTYYYYDEFKVNNDTIIAQPSGTHGATYTIADADGRDYAINVSFSKGFLKSSVSGFLLGNQNVGQTIISADNGTHSNWLDFAESQNDVDITVNVKEYPDTANPLTRTAIKFMFDRNNNGQGYNSGDEWITFSIAKNTDSNYEGGYKYSIQSLADTITDNKQVDFYIMNQAQIDKMNSADGINFRVVRDGIYVDCYLDGELVVSDYDLSRSDSGVTDNEITYMTMRRFDDRVSIGPNGQIPLPIKFSNKIPTANIKLNGTELTTKVNALTNGTVTFDKASYNLGDTVTMTVEAADGYYHNLKANGKNVVIAYTNKTYTFIAEEENIITGDFKTTFFDSSTAWLVDNQYSGILTQPDTVTGHAPWIWTASKYSEIDFTANVREYPENTKDSSKMTRTLVDIKFSNTEEYKYSIAKNKVSEGVYKYTLQPNDNSTDIYTLSPDEIAILKDEDGDGMGIDLRVVRKGTKIEVYVNNVLRHTETITQTADRKAQVLVRRYDDGNMQIDIPFKFVSEDVSISY